MTVLPSPPSFRLDGKRALVTGASSGIGLGCAVALADAGAAVTLAGRRESELRNAEEAMKGKGWQVGILPLDIADTAAVDSAIRRLPPFDVLVNSAGIARHGPALETTAEDFDAVIAVNLRGAYFLSTAVARKLVAAAKAGSIINISSQMGHVGGIERAVYCATKFGVEGFTKAMALEWGKSQIRINTICPTFIRTSLTESTFDRPERLAWIKEKIKLGRIGAVEDVMGAVLYLASDASSLVTGAALMVDGGWTAD